MIIFASDFDGTLHFLNEKYEGYFKQEDLDAIASFQKNGNLFGLCTGRPLYGLSPDMEGAPKLDFVIASTGGVITHDLSVPYEPIEQYVISVKDVDSVNTIAENVGILHIHADGKVYIIGEVEGKYPDQIKLASSSELEGKSVTGISIWTPSEEEAASLIKKLYANTKGTMAFYQNGTWIDVVERSVSKGNAANRVKELFHADLVVGIGDNYNDIPMLDHVDISFTFHRSPLEVQQHASYVVESIAEAIGILNKRES